MILLEAGSQGERMLDAMVVFASQLAARGHSVAIDDSSVPVDLERHLKYEIAPYIASIDKIDVSRIIVIGAEQIEDETLVRLRSHRFSPDVPVWKERGSQ